MVTPSSSSLEVSEERCRSEPETTCPRSRRIWAMPDMWMPPTPIRWTRCGIAPTSVSFMAASPRKFQQYAGDATRGVRSSQTACGLSHASQTLVIVQQFTDKRQHLLQIFVIQDDGGAVSLQVTGVDTLMSAGIRVRHEDRWKADSRQLAEDGSA